MAGGKCEELLCPRGKKWIGAGEKRSGSLLKSTKAFGSSASCTTVSDTAIWSRKPCNPR
jgi:hypothetical protein